MVYDYNLLDLFLISKSAFIIQFLIYGCMPFVLSCLFFLLSYIFSKKEEYLEKISAYECGFEPFDDARQKFNINFYIVAILFLIFDVELIYLFPWTLVISFCGLPAFISVIFFLFILAVGFIYEIFKGALVWP